MYNDELSLYRIRTLRETESLKPVTAIKRIADELKLEGAIRKRFIDRLRKKYPEREKAGTLPEIEPIPPDLEQAIDEDYREAAETRRVIEDSLRNLAKQAEEFGYDPTINLHPALAELREEFDRLRELVDSPPKVAALNLRKLEPRGPEATKELYQSLRERRRVLQAHIDCLSQFLNLQERARRLDEATPPRRS